MDLLLLIGTTMAACVGGMLFGTVAAITGWLCFGRIGRPQWGPVVMLPLMVGLAYMLGGGDLFQIAVLFEAMTGALLCCSGDTHRRQEHLARLARALGADIYARVPG